MNKRSAGVYIVSEQMGGFQIDELDDRVFLQKIIYLLQLLGVNLGFRFSWYKIGPYSSDLAKTAYQIQECIEEYTNELSGVKIRDDVEEKIDMLKNVKDQKPDNISLHKWFELVSSIHYLKYISATDPSSITADNIEDQLHKAGKTNFNSSHIRAAWDQLESLGLIERKSLRRI